MAMLAHERAMLWYATTAFTRPDTDIGTAKHTSKNKLLPLLLMMNSSRIMDWT